MSHGLGDLAELGSEVVAPDADAMGFVDDEALELLFRQCLGQRRIAGQALGRDVEKADPAVVDVPEDLGSYGATRPPGDALDGAKAASAPEIVDLVLDEGDQRTDHHGGSVDAGPGARATGSRATCRSPVGMTPNASRPSRNARMSSSCSSRTCSMPKISSAARRSLTSGSSPSTQAQLLQQRADVVERNAMRVRKVGRDAGGELDGEGPGVLSALGVVEGRAREASRGASGWRCSVTAAAGRRGWRRHGRPRPESGGRIPGP